MKRVRAKARRRWNKERTNKEERSNEKGARAKERKIKRPTEKSTKKRATSRTKTYTRKKKTPTKEKKKIKTRIQTRTRRRQRKERKRTRRKKEGEITLLLCMGIAPLYRSQTLSGSSAFATFLTADSIGSLISLTPLEDALPDRRRAVWKGLGNTGREWRGRDEGGGSALRAG